MQPTAQAVGIGWKIATSPEGPKEFPACGIRTLLCLRTNFLNFARQKKMLRAFVSLWYKQ
jgi:hypothetical protein